MGLEAKPDKVLREEKVREADPALSRRAVLSGASALGVAALAGAAVLGIRGSREQRTHTRKEEETPHKNGNHEARELSFLDVANKPQKYSMGSLAGSKFGGLLTRYTGISGAVPQEVRIDFQERLAQLWRVKLERGKASNNGVYPSEMFAAAHEIFSSYNKDDPHFSNLENHWQSIDRALKDVRRKINLSKLSSIKEFEGITSDHLSLFKKVESLLDTTGVFAYSITELMPTRGEDAPKGVELFDFLLRNAGEDFIDRIPALGDNMISVGPYQFTAYALYENERQGEFHGASIIQKYLLDQRQIPGSVVQLIGNDHHKAAYLLALYNLASAIRHLSQKQAKALASDKEWVDAEDVIAFVSAAHNLPAPSFRAFEAYADEYLAHKRAGKQMKYDLREYIAFRSPQHAGPYATKTGKNYDVIKERLRK